MIRRQKSMRFLGGFYAFPGGKVDPEDGAPDILARCRGISEAEAGRLPYNGVWDTHLNADGAQIVASAIAGAIANDYDSARTREMRDCW